MQIIIDTRHDDKQTIVKAISFLKSLAFDESAAPSPVAQTPTTSAAPVVTPTPSPATPPVDPNQRDKDGLPWDERIHSSSRTINDTGKWKKRKGVTDEEVARVTAELLGTKADAPAQQVVTPAPIPVVAPVPVSLPVAAPAPTPAPVPVPLAQPVAAAVPVPLAQPVAAVAPVQQATAVDWNMICAVMNQKMTEGKTNAEHLNQIAAHFGVEPAVFAMISTQPALWPQVYSALFNL